jgi:hypothetical protein
LFFPAKRYKPFFSYYDQSVLGFLQEFHRNSLFTNVHLSLSGENRRKFDDMSQMMTQLLPSITSIESLRPIYVNYDYNADFFRGHYNMLASSRILIKGLGFIPIILNINKNINNVNRFPIPLLSPSILLLFVYFFSDCKFAKDNWYWYRHWLHISREDGNPRVLVVTDCLRSVNGPVNQIHPFIENIKKV